MDEDDDLQIPDGMLVPYDTVFPVEPGKVPFIGLNNLGNTCFFNSIVQILFYCPGFRQLLAPTAKHIKTISEHTGKEESPAGELNERALEAKDKCVVLLELCDLFAQMQSNQLSLAEETLVDKDGLHAVRPEKLMNSLRKSYPAFEPYAQQDAQECLRCILSILQDAISFARGKFGKEKDGEIKQSGCKVYGGRKLNADTQGSTTTERPQIENRDPNRSVVKPVSRSTASRKRGVRSILRKPLKLKLGSYAQNAQSEDSCGGSPSKDPHQHDTTPLCDRQNQNVTCQSAKDTGCFARLKKAISEGESANKNATKREDIISTPVKRPNTDDPPSSPPMKRKKLSLSNGIRNFYKPASNLSRPKSLMALDKKKSYTVLKLEKRTKKKDPFKVVIKPDTSVYRLLSEEQVSDTQITDRSTEKRPGSPVLCGRKSSANAENQVVKTAKVTQERQASGLTDFVEKIFQGQLVNEIRCLECENCLLRKEPFMDISLPVKENDADDNDITECSTSNGESPVKKERTCSVGWGLSQFTSTEVLEGDNKYYCEHCRRYVEGERRIQFSKLPPVLTLHLKRFTTSKPVAGGDAFCSMVSKINSPLNVPRQVNLSDWATKSCNETPATYSLFGVVIHSGVTISSGHYLSYVHLDHSSTNPTGGEGQVGKLSSYERSWLEADDERTRILSEKELDSILSPPGTEGVSRTPYLLFYQRDD